MSGQMAKEHELPLEAYKLLGGLLQAEEELFWKRNEVLLVLNGGLVTIFGLLPSSQDAPVTPVRVVLPVVGICVCLIWLTIVRRGEAFYNHWYEQLKYLETRYLAPINIFQLADGYFSTGRVTIGESQFTLDRVSRTLHIYDAMLAAPLVFMAAWVGLLGYALQIK